MSATWKVDPYFHLAQIHRFLPGIVFPLHPFYGDLLPGVDAFAKNDGAERPVAQLIQRYVSIHLHRGSALTTTSGDP